MYSKIVNSKTGQKVSVTSRLGKNILEKYLNVLTGGTSASKKAAPSEENMTLTSQEGNDHVVTKEVAFMSGLVRSLFYDDDDDDLGDPDDEDSEPSRTIPVPNVKSTTLDKVIEFCKHHCDVKRAEREAAAGPMVGTRGRPGIAGGDILIGEGGTHDTEEGNVAVVAIAEARLSTPGSVVAASGGTLPDAEAAAASLLLPAEFEASIASAAAPLKSASLLECGIPQWYVTFVEIAEGTPSEKELFYDLILAADYLKIPPLFNLTCAKMASMMKGKTVHEIRDTFEIGECTEESMADVVDAKATWLVGLKTGRTTKVANEMAIDELKLHTATRRKEYEEARAMAAEDLAGFTWS